MVRNGRQRPRRVLTGAGQLEVRQPRVRDKSANRAERVTFSSKILPPYLRRSKTIDALLLWLYLKGISTSEKQYVYFWADGIHTKVRLEGPENDKQCLLVLMGATADGKKELIAVADGALGFWAALRKVFPETRE